MEKYPMHVLFSMSCFNFVSVAATDLAPNISLRFSDTDKDFVGGRELIVLNSTQVLVFMCNASYPVEWIFHYEQDNYWNTEENKIVETYRQIDNFENPTSPIYTTKLMLTSAGNVSVENFTCKYAASDNSSLQSHVIITKEKAKQAILLEISSQPEDFKLSKSTRKSQKEIDICETTLTVYRVITKNSQKFCWSCETPEGERLQVKSIPCQSPSQCNSIHQTFPKRKSCLKRVNLEGEYYNCDVLEPNNYNPRIVTCQHFGPPLTQLYFHGIHRGNSSNLNATLPAMYFDWSEVNPQDMLYLHPLPKKAYLQRSIHITCEYVRFYFAFGSWLAISSPKRIKYIKGFGNDSWSFSNEPLAIHDKNKGTFKSNFNINFTTTGPHNLYCIGPIWNSTNWINSTSQFVNVILGEKPKILALEATQFPNPFIGQKQTILRCHFVGLPVPKVEWSAPPKVITSRGLVKRGKRQYCEVLIIDFDQQSNGVYKCSVFSELGRDSKTIKILSTEAKENKLLEMHVTTVLIVFIVIVLLVMAIVWKLWATIVHQRKKLRDLTEDEIQEFVEGSPETRGDSRETHLENEIPIEALPFEKKFEIPKEDLHIEYSKVLGSGEFGVVLEGRIIKSVKYMNADCNESESILIPDRIPVAIKICRKNVDVTYFKALLSELKVMAYLGKHENLVSLIGAATGNIRNRELYIAVEICEEGNLESYLKKYNLERPTLPGYSKANVGKTFSKLELFQWCSDIAKGVEYMHEKKVIHADLAIRNVLLTKGLRAKVGDFGLSRRLIESSSYTKQTQCPLPWRNMAIESLKSLIFSPKSDIWSLGVTYWELFSLAGTPYPGITYSSELLLELETGMRLDKPCHATTKIYEFMIKCWHADPQNRPNSTDAIMLCNSELRFLSKFAFLHDN